MRDGFVTPRRRLCRLLGTIVCDDSCRHGSIHTNTSKLAHAYGRKVGGYCVSITMEGDVYPGAREVDEGGVVECVLHIYMCICMCAGVG